MDLEERRSPSNSSDSDMWDPVVALSTELESFSNTPSTTITALQIRCFEHSLHRSFDYPPLVHDILAVLQVVPHLQFLQFILGSDIGPRSCPGPQVPLNHLEELVFTCCRTTESVDFLASLLSFPPSTLIIVEANGNELATPYYSSRSLVHLAPSVSKRFLSTTVCNISISRHIDNKPKCTFTLSGNNPDANPVLSLSVFGTSDPFFRTLWQLSTLLRPFQTIDCVIVEFDCALPATTILRAIAGVRHLTIVSLHFKTHDACVIGPFPNDLSSVNLFHVKDWTLYWDLGLHRESVGLLVQCMTSTLRNSAHVTMVVSLDEATAGDTAPVITVAPLFPVDRLARAYYCNLRLSSNTCDVDIAMHAPRYARSAGDSYLSIAVEMDSARIRNQTLYQLPRFLRDRPITHLWIQIQDMRQLSISQPSKGQWSRIFQAVPRLEELAVCFDIWSSLLGGAEAFFDQLEDPNAPACRKLRCLSLVLTSRTITLQRCLLALLSMVQRRVSMHLPRIQKIRLGVKKSMRGDVDANIHQIIQLFRNYGARFDLDLNDGAASSIGWDRPDMR